MVSRCQMASLLCIIFSSWFLAFGAMAICMITLDQNVSGTYFWNFVNSYKNGTQIELSDDEVRNKTISDTQIIGRIFIWVGSSTILSVFLTWIFTIRQMKANEKTESECKINRHKVNALSDHITDGKTRVIVDNMDDLTAFLVEVKAGNDRCERLLNHWYQMYMRCTSAQAYYAYTNAQQAHELQSILLELLEGYRVSLQARGQNNPRPALEYRATLV